MKKKYIIIASVLILLLFAGLGANYLLSLRKITFTLQNDVTGASVYDSKDKEVKRFEKEGGSALLRAGRYYAIPAGENISKDKINFTVDDKDSTITINPAYSSEYLAKLLKKEKSAIEAAITKKYTSALSDYTLERGALYNHGEWFGGLLAPKVSHTRDRRDPYRIVLHKKDDSWEVVRRPEYILTASRYQEVPVDILRKINELVP